MKASDTNFLQLLNGTKQFLIPIFQRTYSWKEENCEQLFRDVIRVGESQYLDSHFIGSVVTIPDHEGQASLSRFQVIDGQQRLTTITLFILAIIAKAKSLNKQAIGGAILEGISENYLINRHYQGENRYRLVLTQGDFPALSALIENHEIPQNASEKVLQNYQLFCDLLDSEEKIETAFKGLLKLKVVDVTLHPNQDDPQAIFESLNSTGVDLSQADLIRNFVLMRQTHGVQTELYQRYWFPMEQLFAKHEGTRFDRFMQDFLTLYTQSNTQVKSRDVYPLFKQWFLEQQHANEQTAQALMDTLYQAAKYYAAFSLLAEQDAELYTAFKDLRTLVEVASPTIMQLYQCYTAQTLSKTEFIDAVRFLESYILRRLVCDMQTRSLGNTFATLAQKVDAQKPFESLLVALARFSKNSRYPSDREFQEALIHKELYESRICHYVLEKLENTNSKEQLNTQNLTIEHIMPRNENMRKTWQAMLGDNWQAIHQTWLHRIGNLTLTGYNSEYSDKDFATKKTTANGFDTSPLRLNKELKATNSWTLEQMQKRGERLSKEALKVWRALEVNPALVAEYELQEKQRLSGNRNLADVAGINENNQALAELLQYLLAEECSEAITVYAKKNITFYAPNEFIQAIPRARNLTVLFTLDYDDLEPELQALCQDTSNKNFIANATISGVYLRVKSHEDIAAITPLVQRAYSEVVA